MKLYLDESVSVVLANVLAQHGVDCLTVREAGLLGQPDEFQLSVATREHRVFFTHDTRDFSRLASDWVVTGRTHAGILLAHQLPLRGAYSSVPCVSPSRPNPGLHQSDSLASSRP